jgi:hypothetical protein
MKAMKGGRFLSSFLASALSLWDGILFVNRFAEADYIHVNFLGEAKLAKSTLICIG